MWQQQADSSTYIVLYCNKHRSIILSYDAFIYYTTVKIMHCQAGYILYKLHHAARRTTAYKSTATAGYIYSGKSRNSDTRYTSVLFHSSKPYCKLSFSRHPPASPNTLIWGSAQGLPPGYRI